MQFHLDSFNDFNENKLELMLPLEGYAIHINKRFIPPRIPK